MSSDDERGTEEGSGGVAGGTEPRDTDQAKAEPERTLESILEEWRQSLSWLVASWSAGLTFAVFGLPVLSALIPFGYAGYSIYRMWQQVAEGEDEFWLRSCPSHRPPWMTPTVAAGPEDPRAIAIGCLWYWLRWLVPAWAASLVVAVGIWPHISLESWWGLLVGPGLILPLIPLFQAVRKTLPDRKGHFFGPLF